MRLIYIKWMFLKLGALAAEVAVASICNPDTCITGNDHFFLRSLDRESYVFIVGEDDVQLNRTRYTACVATV